MMQHSNQLKARNWTDFYRITETRAILFSFTYRAQIQMQQGMVLSVKELNKNYQWKNEKALVNAKRITYCNIQKVSNKPAIWWNVPVKL